MRQATSLISGLYDKPFNERLVTIKIYTIKYNKMRCDMTLVNKIIRGHNFKLYKPLIQATIGEHVFSVRVINNWKPRP